MVVQQLKIFFVFAVVLGSVGCMPSNVWVKQADLENLERSVSAIEQQAFADRLSYQEQLLMTRHSLASLIDQKYNSLASQIEQLELTTVVYQPQIEFLDNGGASAEELAGDEAYEETQGEPAYVSFKGKLVVGEVEKVVIQPGNRFMLARIDTGAATSSLDARNIQAFERDGERWVRFELVDRQSDEKVDIERPVERYVRIVQASAEQPERRPVVKMNITLGNLQQSVEFTLSDRRHLSFGVLIGRNVLRDLVLVDVGQKHLAPPERATEARVP